ncbi:hypothetical protein [Streptomyces sp. NBC_00212]|uniref:hypothetical protein n=1 Tax=Streptomyces sp. NBC_00212 TaxID=2975684 RepID=UPI003251E686
MDQADHTFHVTLRFAPTGSVGPAVEGSWASRATAEHKLREWIGLYGTTPATATIRLWEQHPDGRRDTLDAWPQATA